jgi:hypothetical protein
MAAPRKSEEKDILKSAMASDAAEEGDHEETAPAAKAAGKGKGKKKPEFVKPALAGPKEAMITYTPRVDGDKAFTVWYGIKFTANVPKKVTNRELITSALTNPWFSVNGKAPPPLPKQQAPRDTSEDVKAQVIDEKLEVEAEDALAQEPFVEDVN